MSAATSPTIITSRRGYHHHYHQLRNFKSCSLPATVSIFNSSFYLIKKHPSNLRIQRASQAAELFPSVSPDVVVREACLEDYWEVADTHCTTFFPTYSFPWNLMLRINRMLGLLAGFSVPKDCRKTCLVAVTGSSTSADHLFLRSGGSAIGGFEWNFFFDKGSVAGILTLDTVADFLPRKGPLQQRRTGIAYISNVAVRETDRRKGIAKRLVAKAEALATSWRCHAIALHCDAENEAAMGLYLGQGFTSIKVRKQAKWPQPRTSPSIHFNFMLKILTTNNQPSTI